MLNGDGYFESIVSGWDSFQPRVRGGNQRKDKKQLSLLQFFFREPMKTVQVDVGDVVGCKRSGYYS